MSNKPTESELQILRVLWRSGPSNVRTVNAALSAEQNRAIGYTTTLKLLQLMFEKGLVSREKEGRGHRYTAAIDRTETRGKLLDRLVDHLFEGSASQLVMQALGQHAPDADELAEIKTLIERLERENSNDHE